MCDCSIPSRTASARICARQLSVPHVAGGGGICCECGVVGCGPRRRPTAILYSVGGHGRMAAPVAGVRPQLRTRWVTQGSPWACTFCRSGSWVLKCAACCARLVLFFTRRLPAEGACSWQRGRVCVCMCVLRVSVRVRVHVRVFDWCMCLCVTYALAMCMCLRNVRCLRKQRPFACPGVAPLHLLLQWGVFVRTTSLSGCARDCSRCLVP